MFYLKLYPILIAEIAAYGGAMNKSSEFATKFRINSKDTGSPEFQVAVLTHRINGLQTHFATNKHDVHSQLGLMKLVNRRRKLLRYLKTTNFDRYKTLIDKLDLRK